MTINKWELEALRRVLLNRPRAVEDYPFGPDAAVFKVRGKMFALVGLRDDPLRINLKCDPDEAQAMRAIFPSVLPGYHMNKEHWNTVILDGSMEESLVRDMIDASYELVTRGLSKANRQKLQS